MEKFYLDNAQLYQRLVRALDVSHPAPHFSRHKATPANTGGQAARKKSDIVTTARIRPMLDGDHASGFPCAIDAAETHSDESHSVYLHDLHNHPRGRPLLRSSKHEVDRLYDESATTEDVFSDLVADIVAFAQQGGIGTVFAYGQTGSGKTFTISQLQKLAAVSLTSEAALSEYGVHVTIVDLAGNSAYDLLDSRKPIAVLQDSAGDTQLAGAKEHHVSSSTEMISLIEQAASYRRTASTLRNDASSRSHSICRVRIHSKKPENQIDGLLFLVDLAGSEAARDVSEHGADRMRETREINMSLSVLKDCIRGKAQATLLRSTGSAARLKKLHVPIRQSTLTKVLKHVFDPYASRPCKTAVIACVNPSLADVASSKNTLRYAEMLRAPASTVQ